MSKTIVPDTLLVRRIRSKSKRLKSSLLLGNTHLRSEYGRLINESPFCIHIIDKKRILRFMNQAGLNLLNESLSSIIGEPFIGLISPPDREKIENALAKAFKGHVIDCEFRSIEGLHIHASFLPFKNQHNQVYKVYGFSKDITSDFKAKEELLKSEEKYRLLVDNSPVCIHQLNLDAELVSMNKAGLYMLHAGQEQEVIGLDYLNDLVSHDDKQRIAKLFERAKKGITSSFEFKAVNDQFYRSGFVPLTNEQGNVIRIMGLSEDITEQKIAEQELKLAATAFEAHDAIMILDEKRHILRVNHAFSEVTGYEADEVIGLDTRFLRTAGFSAHAEKIELALKIKGRWQGELFNIRKNGEVYPQSESITAVKNKKNGVSHYVSVFSDRTEQYEQQKVIAQNMAEEKAIGELLALSLQQSSIATYFQQILQALTETKIWADKMPKAAIIKYRRHEDEQYHLDDVMDIGVPKSITELLCQHRLSKKKQLADCFRLNKLTPMFSAFQFYYCLPIKVDDELYVEICIFLLNETARTKPNSTLFYQRITDVISMGLSRRIAEEKIVHQAFHDALTNLPNRYLLNERLTLELKQSKRSKNFGAVIFIDLDNFKTFNDALGHTFGDQLLKEVAKRLTTETREIDSVARLGGDEFVVILTQLGMDIESALSQAHHNAERLREKLGEVYPVNDGIYHLTFSMGLTLFPSKTTTSNDLLRQADTAMYRSKSEGKNTLRFFQPSMQEAATKRLKLETDLRSALTKQELEIHFQPQINHQGFIQGCEALLRWHHPTLGLIPPDDFIPIAEDTNMIISIGNWVLRESCIAMLKWTDSYGDKAPKTVAINVSPKQFSQTGYVDLVKNILTETQLPPSKLMLELTEGLLISNIEQAIERMLALRELGVRFSIDDFGTGYSSLSYLKRFPLSELKIDRSFVQDITNNKDSAAIVSTIIAMAEHLQLSVVAEGVELDKELQFLTKNGCHIYQGYYFSKPLSKSLFNTYIEQLTPTQPSSE